MLFPCGRRLLKHRVGHAVLDKRSEKMRKSILPILGLVIARTVAWLWTLIAGVGGLALLIHRGPLPITNGWFAMFSGIAACPLTASLLKKYAGVTVPGYVQFAVSLLIMVAGRIAVVVVLHRPFLPQS
jgi:hypothetical protein